MHPDVLLDAWGGRPGAPPSDLFVGADGDLLAALVEQASPTSWRGRIVLLEETTPMWSLDVEVTPPVATVRIDDRSWTITSSLLPLIVAKAFGVGVRRRSPAEPSEASWEVIEAGAVDGAERTLLLAPSDDRAASAVVQLDAGALLVAIRSEVDRPAVLLPRTGTEIWCYLADLLSVPSDEVLDAVDA